MMKEGTYYTARQGDCISSIAHQNGLFWKNVWNHAKNRHLKALRANPNVLQAGDLVFLPNKAVKQEDGETEKLHRFLLKGVPAKLRIRLTREPDSQTEEPTETIETGRGGKDLIIKRQWPEQESVEEEPCANVPYVLQIDGQVVIEDETDEDGYLEASIPPDAQEGKLIVEGGTPQERIISLNLGHLDPIETIVGTKQRLFNLGFESGPIDDTETTELREALRQFQETQGLEINGELNDETKEALQTSHGS
jgi:hypothetical protein